MFHSHFKSPIKIYQTLLTSVLLVSLAWSVAEADWYQKASAAFHTKNSSKFLKGLFLGHFVWEITKASRQLPHCHNGQSAPGQ
jgi:hypothetical protein